MTNRLELNWKLDGFVDEQRYYCSETPIDPLNLPVPKAVLAGDVRSYIDTDVEVGKTYYVRVGSVRDEVEKIGAEKITSTEKLLVFMPLTKDLSDIGTLQITWKNSGNITFDEEKGAYFSSFPQSIFQDSHAFNFNDDYKISFDLIRTSSNNTYPSLFNNDESGVWLSGRFSAALAGDNANSAFKNKWLIGVANSYDIASIAIAKNNTQYHYSIERISGVVTIKVNESIVLTGNKTVTIAVVPFLNIGRAPINGIGGQFNGYIRNFKIYDLS